MVSTERFDEYEISEKLLASDLGGFKHVEIESNIRLALLEFVKAVQKDHENTHRYCLWSRRVELIKNAIFHLLQQPNGECFYHLYGELEVISLFVSLGIRDGSIHLYRSSNFMEILFKNLLKNKYWEYTTKGEDSEVYKKALQITQKNTFRLFGKYHGEVINFESLNYISL